MPRPKAVVAALLLLLTTTADGSPAQRDLALERAALTGGQAGSPTSLPAGWRWESYGGVEVGVPGGWGWQDRSLRLDTCVLPPNPAPMVARPSGIVPAIGCPEGWDDDSTRIRHTGWVVGFGHEPGHADGVEHAGDRTTVWLGGVEVAIQTPSRLRERIAATVHRVGVDSSGCPVDHPLGGRPGDRPPPAVPVTALRGVTAVAACRYTVPDGYATVPPRPLISSLRLHGPAAVDAVRRIAAAPAGVGPDNPGDCTPEASLGTETIVLRVHSAAGPSEIMMGYAGCTGNGFDDGVMRRRLTAAAVAPFIAGPNEVSTFSGRPEKAAMLSPGPR